jgi:hypothetical protein
MEPLSCGTGRFCGWLVRCGSAMRCVRAWCLVLGISRQYRVHCAVCSMRQRIVRVQGAVAHVGSRVQAVRGGHVHLGRWPGHVRRVAHMPGGRRSVRRWLFHGRPPVCGMRARQLVLGDDHRRDVHVADGAMRCGFVRDGGCHVDVRPRVRCVRLEHVHGHRRPQLVRGLAHVHGRRGSAGRRLRDGGPRMHAMRVWHVLVDERRHSVRYHHDV